jgi:hypothetical protein
MSLEPHRNDAKVPTFYERLKPEDQVSYRTMQAVVSRPENRYNRFRRLATLRSSVDEIRKFCIRGDDSDCARCLVCGICWLDRDEIGINTRQLRLLIAKSKSSINGAFAKMNYVTLPSRGKELDRLCRALPLLKEFPTELRQWTIRSPVEGTTLEPIPIAVFEEGWDLEGLPIVFDRECARLCTDDRDLDMCSLSVCQPDNQKWENIDPLLDS